MGRHKIDNEERKKLAHALRVCRVIRGLKSGQVADALGITNPHMSELESGRRPAGGLLVPWQKAVGWRPEILKFVEAIRAGQEVEVVTWDAAEPEGDN